MKKYHILVLVSVFCFLSGCATNSDLRVLRTEMDMKISAAEEKNSALVQTESAALRKELEKTSVSIPTLRKAEADLRADITELRDQLRQLRGITESLQKDGSDLKHRISDYRELKERLDQTSFKVNYIENFLDIGKKEERPDGAVDKSPKNSGKKNGSVSKKKGDKETLYAQAYESFKAGKYDKARTEFQNFLKSYPDTEYSSNAQFWIGECYYFEKKYEKAILEYEKVIKNFPDGNKVPYALLKQGLSFLSLGDKTSAKAIFQSVMKDYPNTNQARSAREKLLKIK